MTGLHVLDEFDFLLHGPFDLSPVGLQVVKGSGHLFQLSGADGVQVEFSDLFADFEQPFKSAPILFGGFGLLCLLVNVVLVERILVNRLFEATATVTAA